MRLLSGRIVFDLALLAGAAWGLWQSQSLPPGYGGGDIGPGDFPRAVLVLGVVALLAVLRQDVSAALRRAHDVDTPPHLQGTFAALLISALLIAYVLLLEPLGFLAATGAFLFFGFLACSRFLDPPNSVAAWRRTLLGAALVAAVATGLSFFVFTYGFGLIFP